MRYFDKSISKAGALIALAVFTSVAQAAETLTLSGLHTNSNVMWTLGSMTETSGSGAFYGSYTNGGSSSVDPLFCIDLFGWVSVPSTFSVQQGTTYSAAGWLVKTYGQAAKGNAVLASALQFAIWNATYDTDLTVSGGTFVVNSDFGSGALAQANLYLASIGGRKAGAVTYIRTTGIGQSQLAAVPGPGALVPFAVGLLGAGRRRLRKA